MKYYFFVILLFCVGCIQSPPKNDSSNTKYYDYNGYYYDDNLNFLDCSIRYESYDVGGSTTTTFYNSKGDKIGKCSHYSGPGSSGSANDHTIKRCDSDALLDNNLEEMCRYNSQMDFNECIEYLGPYHWVQKYKCERI